MNKRLTAILAHIADGAGVIDVGSDHGYIPAALFQRGYPGNIIASDINSGPLESARRTAESAGALDGIEFLLCDGLEKCDGSKIDTIVIAGMGGDAICGILDRAEWCIAPGYTLILQPMTKAEILRFWLINNGFDIVCDEYVRDGIIYQLLVARFGVSCRYSDAELYTGKLENVRGDGLFPEYLDALIRRFEYEDGKMRSSAKGRDSLRAVFARHILDELHEMRDSFEKP